MISATGGFLTVAEVALCTTIGGPTVTGSGTASANATATNAPSWAFDDVTSGSNMWTAGNPTYSPSRFRLDYSDDGTTWTAATTNIIPATWVTNVSQSFTVASFPAPPPPDPTAAHRYWRLANLRNGVGGFVSITEVRLCTTVGGATVTGGGTASASSTAGGTIAAQAFDGNTGNYWTGGGAVDTDWLQYDFGSGNSFHIASVVITPRSDAADYSPRYFALQCSDDAGVWVTSQGFFNQADWAVGVPQTFNVGNQVANRYWRFYPIRNAAGGSGGAAEIALSTTYGGATATGGGVASASSGTGVANLFDGNNATNWTVGYVDNITSYVVYDFGATTDIVQASIFPDTATGSLSQTMGTCSLQSSPDGFTWTTKIAISPATWVAGTPQLFPPTPTPSSNASQMLMM